VLTPTDPDGTLGYRSRRPLSFKGDAVLSHPLRGDLIATDYYWGSRRQPQLRYMRDGLAVDEPVLQLKTSGRKMSLKHRETRREFTWSYEKFKSFEGHTTRVLALRVRTGLAKEDTRLIAQLTRNKATRPTGSKTAGGGGLLTLLENADAWLDESLIVATCIVMLKREVDRRRHGQYATLWAIYVP
jgi:hypothetical protein